MDTSTRQCISNRTYWLEGEKVKTRSLAFESNFAAGKNLKSGRSQWLTNENSARLLPRTRILQFRAICGAVTWHLYVIENRQPTSSAPHFSFDICKTLRYRELFIHFFFFFFFANATVPLDGKRAPGRPMVKNNVNVEANIAIDLYFHCTFNCKLLQSSYFYVLCFLFLFF